LIHAWAETSHDITYKRFQGKGFGQRAMASIEARLNKIMDEYLLPAGYDFQKVQHDFQRLMQGKELFDRGTIEALDACADNNERHEILRSLREYVLPNYDDIAAIYPELRAALLRAVDNASVTETQPIETPFGNLAGHTAADVITLGVDIISDLRYVDVGRPLGRSVVFIKRPTTQMSERRWTGALRNSRDTISTCGGKRDQRFS